MAVKHRVIQDFQFVSLDKKIVILKAKSILVDFQYNFKNDSIKIDRDVVENNPEFFSIVDWKEDLVTYFRINKLPQPAILAKKIIPFIEENFVREQNDSANKQIFEVTDREVELETKYKTIQFREENIDNRERGLLNRETELIKKENLLSKKEQELLEFELNLEKKGFDFDLMVLESNKNLDEKQKELNQLLEQRMKEIEKKEIKINLMTQKLSDYISKQKLREVLLEVAQKYQTRDQLINWINKKFT